MNKLTFFCWSLNNRLRFKLETVKQKTESVLTVIISSVCGLQTEDRDAPMRRRVGGRGRGGEMTDVELNEEDEGPFCHMAPCSMCCSKPLSGYLSILVMGYVLTNMLKMLTWNVPLCLFSSVDSICEPAAFCWDAVALTLCYRAKLTGFYSGHTVQSLYFS